MVSGLAFEAGEDDAFDDEVLDGDEVGEDGDDGEAGSVHDGAILDPEFVLAGHQAEEEQVVVAIGDYGRGVCERTDANRFSFFSSRRFALTRQRGPPDESWLVVGDPSFF